MITEIFLVTQLSIVDDAFNDMLQSIINAINTVMDAFVAMITAVPRAVATIFGQWSYIVGNTWYGPILGALTIAAVFLIGYGVLAFVERFLF